MAAAASRSRSAAIRHPAAHTIGPACERRLAVIRQVLADHDVPRHPDAHTIGTACERRPLGSEPAGAGNRPPTRSAPPVSVSRLAAIRQVPPPRQCPQRDWPRL